MKTIDKNLAVIKADTAGIAFHDPDQAPFRLDGFYWREKQGPYRRLPEQSKELNIPEGVNSLADYPAGGQLSFRSNTSRVVIKASFTRAHRIVRMPLTNNMGFDIYVGEGADKLFRGVTAFDFDATEYCVDLFKSDKRLPRHFTINLPAYGEIESWSVGLDEDATLAPPLPWPDARPIVAYGTSILHGACASRPGMCYPNILSRKLNRPVLNLGFAGSAKGEPEMARILADIHNPALYLLDYDPNSGIKGARKTLYDFIKVIKAKHPDTPVVTVSNIPYPGDYPETPGESGLSDRLRQFAEVHRDAVARSLADGCKNVYYIDGAGLLGADYTECSVDGCHISDLGFYRMAEALYPELKRILSQPSAS